jgi:hypothetical protein
MILGNTHNFSYFQVKQISRTQYLIKLALCAIFSYALVCKPNFILVSEV